MQDESARSIPGIALAAVFAVIAALFVVRNLPWHLDDYDQAKQAFTSYEMANGGSWLYQHTPPGRIATKPPFAGWVSAGLRSAGLPWDVAWRLPGLACAGLMLVALWRLGSRLWPGLGGLLAVSAFSFNLVTPRVVTLVRTDMMLATLIFFTGAICLRKVAGETWTRRDQWIVAALVLAALMTKGPIVYAFLGPGWAAYAWLSRKIPNAGRAWPGGWCVFAPLLVFGAWVWWGIATVPEFYGQVVEREFLRRFETDQETARGAHVAGYYSAVLSARFLPWSLLLLTLAAVRPVRRALGADARLLWLVCWALGGLLCMELVPSKRFDRIFPAFAPLCLLLPAMARYFPVEWSATVRRTALAAIVAAAITASIYAGRDIMRGCRNNEAGLRRFGESVPRITGGGADLAVVMGKDESMVIYTGRTAFTRHKDAVKAWKSGALNWIVMSGADYVERTEKLPGGRVVAKSEPVAGRGDYVLIARDQSPTGAPR